MGDLRPLFLERLEWGDKAPFGPVLPAAMTSRIGGTCDSSTTKEKNSVKSFFGLVVLVSVAFSLPIQGQKRKKEPPQPQIARVSAEVPSFAALAETEQSQVKGGLRITMQPESYQAVESVATQLRQVPPPSLFGIVSVQPSPNSVYVERTQVPKLSITPSRLVLRLRLNNQLGRVFRGAGIAVQFNVAGKTVAVDSSGYGDLINIVLPPRSEQEVTIVGPDIATIPAPSTIGIFLFDVVTNIDSAGNVTEKQNFEWYFSYKSQRVEKEISVLPPERLWMTR
jgi:hypothetical protein